MHTPEYLNQLRESGRMRWMGVAQGWIAEADEVVSALARDGFEECRYTETRHPQSHARGGVWQGLNRSSGTPNAMNASTAADAAAGQRYHRCRPAHCRRPNAHNQAPSPMSMRAPLINNPLSWSNGMRRVR